MNQLCIVGRLKKDAIVRDGKTKFLACQVVVRKAGFGSAAGKVFERKVKLIAFGKEQIALEKKLTDGTLISAIGEAEAEAYVGSDGKPQACLKIIASQLNILSEASRALDGAPPFPGHSSPPPFAGDSAAPPLPTDGSGMPEIGGAPALPSDGPPF